MSKDLFYYPDGSKRSDRPKDGDVCKVNSHKKGKFVEYEWHDSENIWFPLPRNKTPDSVIENAKKILKIGSYKSLRAKKSTYWDNLIPGANTPPGDRPYFSHEEYVKRANRGYGISGLRNRHEHNGHHHHSSRDRHLSNKDFYKQLLNMRRMGEVYEDGSWSIPCECGAQYVSDAHNHMAYCPRHEKNIKKY